MSTIETLTYTRKKPVMELLICNFCGKEVHGRHALGSHYTYKHSKTT